MWEDEAPRYQGSVYSINSESDENKPITAYLYLPINPQGTKWELYKVYGNSTKINKPDVGFNHRGKK